MLESLYRLPCQTRNIYIVVMCHVWEFVSPVMLHTETFLCAMFQILYHLLCQTRNGFHMPCLRVCISMDQMMQSEDINVCHFWHRLVNQCFPYFLQNILRYKFKAYNNEKNIPKRDTLIKRNKHNFKRSVTRKLFMHHFWNQCKILMFSDFNVGELSATSSCNSAEIIKYENLCPFKIVTAAETH